jgi:diadenosine tetraphosphate (Ap4A) HIT family hydrolase
MFFSKIIATWRYSLPNRYGRFTQTAEDLSRLKRPPAAKRHRIGHRRRKAKPARRRSARGDVITSLRRYYRPELARRMTPHQRRVIEQLIGCRSGRYGSRSHYCQQCEHGQITLNSCGNRHCTRCGDGRRSAWRDRMAEIALPVSYLHNVFTTPHELNDVHDLSQANGKAMIQLIFDCAIATIKKIFKKKFGIGMVAMVMTLHSWGQRMLRHVHVHVVLIAGGISVDGKRWIQLDLDTDALEALKRELATEYRRTYLRRLRGRIKKGKIRMSGDGSLEATDVLIAKLKRKNWMVNLQASPKQWEGGSEGIINYLSSYISGAAISDFRIKEDDGQYVTISYKDYRRDSQVFTERMTGEEFVRRFVMHFLPPHCKRIRYAGFYAPQGRAENLARARELIAELHGGELPAVNRRETVSITDDEQQSEARRNLFIGEGKERKTFPATCCRCHRYMESHGNIDGETTLRILPYLLGVMQWLSGKLPSPPQHRPPAVPCHLVLLIDREQRAEARRKQAEKKTSESIRGSPQAA